MKKDLEQEREKLEQKNNAFEKLLGDIKKFTQEKAKMLRQLSFLMNIEQKYASAENILNSKKSFIEELESIVQNMKNTIVNKDREIKGMQLFYYS